MTLIFTIQILILFYINLFKFEIWVAFLLFQDGRRQYVISPCCRTPVSCTTMGYQQVSWSTRQDKRKLGIDSSFRASNLAITCRAYSTCFCITCLSSATTRLANAKEIFLLPVLVYGVQYYYPAFNSEIKGYKIQLTAR